MYAVTINFDDDEVAALDRWRVIHPKLPSRREAVKLAAVQTIGGGPPNRSAVRAPTPTPKISGGAAVTVGKNAKRVATVSQRGHLRTAPVGSLLKTK